jgi:hypothetical protein
VARPCVPFSFQLAKLDKQLIRLTRKTNRQYLREIGSLELGTGADDGGFEDFPSASEDRPGRLSRAGCAGGARGMGIRIGEKGFEIGLAGGLARRWLAAFARE